MHLELSTFTFSVLVFPPVNNYRRFLIHKVVEEQSQDLSTFSIGQGHARRTVVCFKRHVIKKPSLQNDSEPVTRTMGVDQHLDGSANNTALSHETATKRAKAIPAVGIYRPPAARKLEGEGQVLTTPAPAPPSEKPRSGKARRPDIQVYVPRAKRLEVNRKCSLGLSSDSHKAACSELSENRKNQRTNRLSVSNLVISTCNSSPPCSNKRKPEAGKLLKQEDKPAEVTLATSDVHVEKKVKQEDAGSKTHMEVVISDNKDHVQEFTIDAEPVDTITEQQLDKNHARDTATSHDPVTQANSHVGEKQIPHQSDVLIISDPEPVGEHREQELSVKKFPSDVLIISDSQPPSNVATRESSTTDALSVQKEEVPQVPETNIKKTEQQQKPKERQVPLNLNPDECTWDMLFDDNGDCLDPRLMEELTSAVGSVSIEKPQSDYRSYQSRVEMMLSGNAEDEFAHVLEIYNFPPEFKTQDLFTVFSPYMKNGFEIKWVDDTHALGVFSSALIAAEVLAADHPFVKTRPLHQATPESRMKARRSAEFLQPYRARPETCAAMARRLVTGALGVRLTTSAEEREAERRLLREARERKRLAARQRDEAWEGTLMSNK